MERLPQQAIYATNLREEVSPYIPGTAHSVLDVGCGAGGFGHSLRQRLGDTARLVGIEVVPEQVKSARSHQVYEEVLEGYFPTVLEGRADSFDLLVFNDVLEHILDPWETLESSHKYLNAGGKVLATIPSIQFAPILWRIVRGRWDYTDYGTLDRTHVRFFTRATMLEMFANAGYKVESCVGVNSVRKQWGADQNHLRRYLKGTLSNFIADAQYEQFVIVASSLRAHD